MDDSLLIRHLYGFIKGINHKVGIKIAYSQSTLKLNRLYLNYLEPTIQSTNKNALTNLLGHCVRAFLEQSVPINGEFTSLAVAAERLANLDSSLLCQSLYLAQSDNQRLGLLVRQTQCWHAVACHWCNTR